MKFQIDFPLNYPMSRPIVHFSNPNHIWHPLVHPKSGEVNLDFEFPEWQPGKHWAIQILLMVKKLVNLEPYFKLQNKENLVWNKEAHEGFLNRFETEFIEKCQVCVE